MEDIIKPITKHTMFETESLLNKEGWLKTGEGWLDSPFYRNVDLYKKEGFESTMFVSTRNGGQYLNPNFGKHGNFKPLNVNSIKKFEKVFK